MKVTFGSPSLRCPSDRLLAGRRRPPCYHREDEGAPEWADAVPAAQERRLADDVLRLRRDEPAPLARLHEVPWPQRRTAQLVVMRTPSASG